MSKIAETSLDEKIDFVLEWCEEYPKISLSYMGEEEFTIYAFLHDYCSSDEEASILYKRFKKAKEYQHDIEKAIEEDNLTSEQMWKINSSIYNDDNQFEFLKACAKYRISAKKIRYIIKKYKTIHDFLCAYERRELDEEDLNVFKTNIKLCIGINVKKSSNEFSKIDDRLLFRILKYDSEFPKDASYGYIVFFSEEDLLFIINNLLDKRSRIILNNIYGLNGCVKCTYAELAEENMVTEDEVRDYEEEAIRKLDQIHWFRIQHENSNRGLSREEAELLRYKIDKIKYWVFQSNIALSPDDEYKDIPDEDIYELISDILESNLQNDRLRLLINQKIELALRNEELRRTETDATELLKETELLVDRERNKNLEELNDYDMETPK